MFKPARILVFASVLVLLFLLIPFLSPSSAAETSNVIINEIMWMGSSASTADEWLELRNTTDQEVDIGSWQLTKYSKVDGTYQENLMLEVPSGVAIPAKGYFLVSNNNNNHIFSRGESVLDVTPDLVNSKVSLANSKLQIKLYDGAWDGDGILIDAADDGVGVPAAGINEKDGKASMARKDTPGDGTDPDSWYTSTASVGFDAGAIEKGTPGSENADAPDEDPPEDEEEETTYSDQIFLNEIMPNPEGSDDNEYLELYNAGDEEVDLGGWIIKDLTGDKIIGSEIMLSSTLISAKGFLVIYKKDGSVSLNNDGDTIALLNPNDEVVDEVAYPKIKEGLVYQRYPDGDSTWSESNEPTAGAVNKPGSFDSSSPSDSSGPEISFSVSDTDLRVNKSFDIQLKIKNAEPRHDYYVKVRLGLEESKLTKGRTYHSFYDTWLWDGKSWADFPVLYTDLDGVWEGTIKAKVAADNPADTYYVEVRIRDKETEKNYDSGTRTIAVGAEEVTEEETPDNPGSVLGTLTELPATGGGLFSSVVTNLFVTVWLPVLIWMLLIFIGSSLPGASVSENRTVDFAAHKVVHLIEYSVLFVLIWRAVKKSVRKSTHLYAVASKLLTLFSFGLTVGYAVTDEIHQFFVPGRDARLTDVLIDASAAFLGWLLVRRKKLVTVAVILILTGVTTARAKDILSLAVPDDYEVKEGEIDHLSSTIEVFDTQGAAVNFRPNFNFDLAGFATFVYSYEGYYGKLDPSVFNLSIYEGMMEHADLDKPILSRAKLLTTTVVDGIAGEAPNYQLFFKQLDTMM